MDNVNTLKLKELGVILSYHSGSEIMKRIPDKVELVEAVTVF